MMVVDTVDVFDMVIAIIVIMTITTMWIKVRSWDKERRREHEAFIRWQTNVERDIRALAESESRQDEMLKELRSINDRLSRIEAKSNGGL